MIDLHVVAQMTNTSHSVPAMPCGRTPSEVVPSAPCCPTVAAVKERRGNSQRDEVQKHRRGGADAQKEVSRHRNWGAEQHLINGGSILCLFIKYFCRRWSHCQK